MKCLIIDDEEVFRIQLKGLLEEIGGIDVIGEAAGCKSGVELIRKHPEVDLLILDVELPDGTSFDIIRQFDRLPKLLFITSHEEYALSAFEVSALDYIQKPMTLERVRKALDRLEESPVSDGKLPTLEPDDLILLCCNKYKHFTRTSEIVVILSDENYTHIICQNGNRFVMKKTMAAWEKQLPDSLFMRIGRQHLVNRLLLERMESKERGGLLWFKGVTEPLQIKQCALKSLQKLAKPI